MILLKDKILYHYIEPNDTTPIQKLTIADQLRILLRRFTYNKANDTKNEELVTQEYLTLRSNLSDFLRRATEPIREGKKSEVIVNVSSIFMPVYEDVIKSAEIANYYTVSEVRPKLMYDIPYDIMLKLRVK